MTIEYIRREQEYHCDEILVRSTRLKNRLSQHVHKNRATAFSCWEQLIDDFIWPDFNGIRQVLQQNSSK